ncbi:MAG: MCE family protein [Bacteroidetes bacterium]|jgi:paraquat-inducible protein B|nr:MCE family protein [Bacteroidota bacterium]
MSIRAHPTAIGIFLIGALALTVLGVAVLSSSALFTQRSTFVSYFGESVNGLEIGAPVKFQGVRVGSVTNLLIRIELTDKTFEVPVEYEIDLSRLTSQSGTFVNLSDEAVLRQQVDDGLRAQLQMESIVTGQLYVELTYRPGAVRPDIARGPGGHLEIPSTPSLMAAFGTQAGSLVGDAMRILFRVNEMLEEIDMQSLNASVVATAQSIERLAEAPEIRAAFAEVPAMTAQFNRTMAEMEMLTARLGGAIEPLQGQLDSTNAEVILTLQSMRRASDATQGLISTDSGVGYQMEEAFTSLKEAADALRTLVVSLERNPDMLLRGRKPTPQQP